MIKSDSINDSDILSLSNSHIGDELVILDSVGKALRNPFFVIDTFDYPGPIAVAPHRVHPPTVGTDELPIT